MSLPVDLWVVLCKPGESKDDVLLPEVNDSECGPLQVAINTQDCINDLGYGPVFIWYAIYIIDKDWLSESELVHLT